MASIASVPGHGASIERHRCRHRSRALADHTWTDGTQHSQDVVLQLPAQVFMFFQPCWGGTRLLAQFITGHGGFTVSFEQIGYRKEVCIGNLFPMSWQAHHHPGSTDLLEVHFTPLKVRLNAVSSNTTSLASCLATLPAPRMSLTGGRHHRAEQVRDASTDRPPERRPLALDGPADEATEIVWLHSASECALNCVVCRNRRRRRKATLRRRLWIVPVSIWSLFTSISQSP